VGHDSNITIAYFVCLPTVWNFFHLITDTLCASFFYCHHFTMHVYIIMLNLFFISLAGPATILVLRQSCPLWKSNMYRKHIRETTRAWLDRRQRRRPSPSIYLTVSSFIFKSFFCTLVYYLPSFIPYYGLCKILLKIRPLLIRKAYQEDMKLYYRR